MAFCTECGYKLIKDAVFCPNCGTLIAAANISGNEFSIGTAGNNIRTEYYKTQSCNTDNELYSKPLNPYSITSSLGYPPTLDMKPKGNNGRIAAIILLISVIILALAGFLIYSTTSEDNPYVGYWESSAIDNGKGELTDIYLGRNVAGLFGIQINNDGSAYIASAFNKETYNAQWVTIEGGIEATAGKDTYDLTIMNGKLFLRNEDRYIVFDKSDKDIDNPSVTHGSISGSGDTYLSPQPDSQTNNNIAGSGYVGNDNY